MFFLHHCPPRSVSVTPIRVAGILRRRSWQGAREAGIQRHRLVHPPPLRLPHRYVSARCFIFFFLLFDMRHSPTEAVSLLHWLLSIVQMALKHSTDRTSHFPLCVKSRTRLLCLYYELCSPHISN